MSSNSSSKANLSGALSSLNIDVNNESNNEELEAANAEIINAATIIGTSNNADNIDNVITCAACGKEGEGDSMNTCNKCDLVKYCNAACKKKHRHKHKKKCERRVAELYDEKLFKEHPPREECPICMLSLPYESKTITFQSCCGKSICSGCIYVMRETGSKNMKLCPFCKTPPARSNAEEVERLKKLMEKGNAYAFNQLAGLYARVRMGVPQDWLKANELYLKAGELGCADGYFNLGCVYQFGQGVEVDMKKAKHYYELTAMSGSVMARHNLGSNEYNDGNLQRAFKHYMLSARAGCKESLENVKQGYIAGHVTKINTQTCYENAKRVKMG